MKKSVTQLWVTALTGILCLGVVFAYSATKNLSSQREVQGAGAGAPTLKLTWDFSANTSTSTTALTAAQLKTFIEKYDAPSYSYTVNSTANNYNGSSTMGYPDGVWKFSSSSKNGSANISGLPSYTLVKVWAYQWGTDAATLAVNGGTAQTITGAAFKLYTFDGFVNQTSFVVSAVKRSIIQKIEFYGC